MCDVLNLPGVEPVSFDKGEPTITIGVKAIEGEAPLCPVCNRPTYRHGERKNVFADTPMQMQPVKLKITRPRYRCPACGKTVTPKLECIDENRRATKRLVEGIRKDCLSKTFHDLAELTGLTVGTIKNIANDLIDDLKATVHYETPEMMGIDEVMIAGEYRCVITNLAMNTVFDILEHRTQLHLNPYFANLPDRGKVQWVCTDMWRPFKRSFRQSLPNARLIIDKFHLVKMANEALEEERKIYQAMLPTEACLLMKKTPQWVMLRRTENLTLEGQKDLNLIRQYLPSLARAYDAKEAFFQIYDEPDKGAAMRAFEAWENTLPQNSLPKFHDLAKTVHNFYDDIFAYWDAPHPITNAYTECLNGLNKMTNRRGRGYSYEILRARILFDPRARKVGSVPRPSTTKGCPETIEYGPSITILAEDD